MRVTIKEIARELGISHSTVSRVLNEKQSALVSQATRERIVQAANQMGYRPNRLAQALKGASTQLLGVFLPDGRDYFFQEVLSHLRRLVEPAGFELIPFPSPAAQVSTNWMRLLHWDMDGVFVFDYMFYADGLWEALVLHKGYIPPMVGLCSHRPRLNDYVALDFRPALEKLMAHFRAQGCRRIGYLAFPENFHPDEQRYAVCSTYAWEHELEMLDMPLPLLSNLCEAGRLGVHAYIRSGNLLPDAIFCHNDEICLGAYRALYECGIKVPEQVALAGCDDVPYAQYLETPLTTLALPAEALCREGWRILQDRMADPGGPPLQVTLEASLTLRESTFKQRDPVSALG